MVLVNILKQGGQDGPSLLYLATLATLNILAPRAHVLKI